MPKGFHPIIFSFFEKVLEVGTHHEPNVIRKQRLIYFNAIVFSLPTVYAIFVLKDINTFIKPLDSWQFDQYGFFVFIFICGLCSVLNRTGLAPVAKWVFLLSWPMILHIIPIIIQHTPADYYYAFPTGIIFHSLMIQAIYSRRTDPLQYWIVLGANFVLMLYFLEILKYYDTDNSGQTELMVVNDYYAKVVFLYWLLFNLVITYMLGSIDYTLLSLSKSNETVAQQKEDLQGALEELKASKEKLVESEKLTSLGVFTAGIAHNLNNPLNFISSGVIVLSERLQKIKKKLNKKEDVSDEDIEHLNKSFFAIQTGVEKSTTVIQSLRNYTRPSTGEHIKYNLVQCLEDALTLFPEKYLHHVTIEKNLPEEVIVPCNPSKMSQLFLILIQNAIDACGEKGQLKLEIQHKSTNRILVKIIDNGSGIPKENLVKIFDPFFSTKEVDQGTGLGLYVAYGIVKEHNGKIEIDSEVGQGTTVMVTIPS